MTGKKLVSPVKKSEITQYVKTKIYVPTGKSM